MDIKKMWFLGLTASLLLSAGCGGDTQTGGFNDPCASATGALVGCPPTSSGERAADIEAACWKLIDCNAFGLESDDNFDPIWARCVGDLRSRSLSRLDFALECIGRSSCEDLRDGGANNSPRTGPCFAFGDN